MRDSPLLACLAKPHLFLYLHSRGIKYHMVTAWLAWNHLLHSYKKNAACNWLRHFNISYSKKKKQKQKILTNMVLLTFYLSTPTLKPKKCEISLHSLRFVTLYLSLPFLNFVHHLSKLLISCLLHFAMKMIRSDRWFSWKSPKWTYLLAG